MAEKLLRLVGPLHILVGLALFLTFFSSTASSALVSIFGLPPDHPWSPFFIAIIGPTVASWGVLFAVVVKMYFASPSKTLWNTMLVSVLIWMPLDTSLCAYFGLWQAVFLNVVVAVTILILLVLVRNQDSVASQERDRQ